MGVVASRGARQIAYGLNHYDMGLWGPATIRPLLSAANSLEKTDPPDPRLPRILLALGTMAASRQRDDLAENFFRRALRAAEALRPPDATQTRNALVDLGLFYHRKGRGADALPFLERAVDISAGLPERALHAIDLGGIENRTRGVILHNLAGSYVDQGRYGEAEPLYRESLTILEAGSPRDVERWRIRTVLASYATLLRRTGRTAEAQALERRAETMK